MRSVVALLVALLAVPFDQGILRASSLQAAGFHSLLWNITSFKAVSFWDFYSGGGLSPLTLLSYNLLLGTAGSKCVLGAGAVSN